MARCKKDQAFTVVEILIVVGIISLIAAISIPNLIVTKRLANEIAAKGNLRSLANATETASVSLGYYPTTVAQLSNFIGSAPSFCADATGGVTQLNGYSYSCTFDITGYTYLATPVTFGTSGSITYTATTGAIITP